MAGIRWGEADSSGELPNELATPRPSPADRLRDYAPDYDFAGRVVTTLDRAQHAFNFRDDHTAKIAVRYLAPSQLADMVALKQWMVEGNEVTVVSDDADEAEYVCTLKPGTRPEIVLEDEERLFYAYRCEVVSDDPILIDYSA